MPKRKLQETEPPRVSKHIKVSNDSIHLQVVTGSYERVLHGLTVTIPRKLLQKHAVNGDSTKALGETTFEDAFLFKAHTSSIRSLAISPPSTSSTPKRILATGGSDAAINLYHLSTTPPAPAPKSTHGLLPSLLASTSRNKTLGTLNTHDAAITALAFPHSARNPLLSACAGNVLALTHTRTWTTLSLLKAPTPKYPGRPSGDTASSNTYPAGANAVAVHPSNKLLLSVHRGERCLRLWNLVTGKKAGVLAFERGLLRDAGEAGAGGRVGWGRGEGRSVVWEGQGREFAVGFDRGIAVFGADCAVQSVIRPVPEAKVHEIRYLVRTEDEDPVLAVATEAGEVQFYSTAEPPQLLGRLKPLAETGTPSRIKAFEILSLPAQEHNKSSSSLVVTASSDGVVRVWNLDTAALQMTAGSDSYKSANAGTLLGSCETGNRILCLGSFVLDGDEHSNGVAENGSGDVGDDVKSNEDGDEEEDEAEDETFNGIADDKDGENEEEFNGLDD